MTISFITHPFSLLVDDSGIPSKNSPLVNCGEWIMRSLWELDTSTVVLNDLQAQFGMAPATEESKGKMQHTCLRNTGFFCYDVMPLLENCCSTFLFTTVYKRLAEDWLKEDWLEDGLIGWLLVRSGSYCQGGLCGDCQWMMQLTAAAAAVELC
jgi:hypothetical protein